MPQFFVVSEEYVNVIKVIIIERVHFTAIVTKNFKYIILLYVFLTLNNSWCVYPKWFDFDNEFFDFLDQNDQTQNSLSKSIHIIIIYNYEFSTKTKKIFLHFFFLQKTNFNITNACFVLITAVIPELFFENSKIKYKSITLTIS